MYELIFVVCLLTQPESCKTERPAFQELMGIAQCMLEGQFMMATWLQENPEWQIKSWRCDLPRA